MFAKLAPTPSSSWTDLVYHTEVICVIETSKARSPIKLQSLIFFVLRQSTFLWSEGSFQSSLKQKTTTKRVLLISIGNRMNASATKDLHN